MALSKGYLKKAKAALADAKKSGNTQMSREMMIDTVGEVGNTHPAFKLAHDLFTKTETGKKYLNEGKYKKGGNDKSPYRYKYGFKDFKKGGKVKRKPRDGRVKKAKCRDGIAIRGKTKGKIR